MADHAREECALHFNRSLPVVQLKEAGRVATKSPGENQESQRGPVTQRRDKKGQEKGLLRLQRGIVQVWPRLPF